MWFYWFDLLIGYNLKEWARKFKRRGASLQAEPSGSISGVGGLDIFFTPGVHSASYKMSNAGFPRG